MPAAGREARGIRPRGGHHYQVRVNRSTEEEELRQKAHQGWAGGGAGGGAEIVNQAFREFLMSLFGVSLYPWRDGTSNRIALFRLRAALGMENIAASR